MHMKVHEVLVAFHQASFLSETELATSIQLTTTDLMASHWPRDAAGEAAGAIASVASTSDTASQ